MSFLPSRARRGAHRLLATSVGAALALVGTAAIAAPAASAATARGPEGQTLTVSKVEGLNPDGDTLQVRGQGYDPSKGIYVVLCVANGGGQQPGPCLGGADMEGAGGGSAWISSNPPSYGEGLATPFTESGGKGSFAVSVAVTASDEFTDCLDPAQAPNGCVIGTRADHTRTGDRSADVLLPVSFAEPGSTDSSTDAGTDAGDETNGGTGTTGTTGDNGTDTTSGSGTATGTGQGSTDSTETDGPLARTGASIGITAAAAAVLLGGGGGLLLARRRASTTSPDA